MTKLTDTPSEVRPQTIIGVFNTHDEALAAIHTLQQDGMPADRIGIVSQNVRQAREPMGSYSPQGALIGAAVGFVLTLLYVVFGGDTVRSNAFAIVLGGFILVVGLAFIGFLAGRGRVFKQDEFKDLEDDVASGETLVQVVCDTPDGADETRADLERAGARDIRFEGTGESV
jgi:heat induced stress protein YflT